MKIYVALLYTQHTALKISIIYDKTFKMKPEDDNKMQSWIMYLFRGILTEPNDNFLKCCYTVESTFKIYHSPNDLCHGNGVTKHLIDIICVKVHLPFEVVKMFVKV
jgi:hypothetical protein